MLSPTGWAVAVDADGRATGVVSQQTIAEAIRGAHAEGGARDADGGGSDGRGEGRTDVKVAG